MRDTDDKTETLKALCRSYDLDPPPPSDASMFANIIIIDIDLELKDEGTKEKQLFENVYRIYTDLFQDIYILESLIAEDAHGKFKYFKRKYK